MSLSYHYHCCVFFDFHRNYYWTPSLSKGRPGVRFRSSRVAAATLHSVTVQWWTSIVVVSAQRHCSVNVSSTRTRLYQMAFENVFEIDKSINEHKFGLNARAHIFIIIIIMRTQTLTWLRAALRRCIFE